MVSAPCIVGPQDIYPWLSLLFLQKQISMLLLQIKNDEHILDGNLFKSLHEASSRKEVPNY
jgi:hypothetical protein